MLHLLRPRGISCHSAMGIDTGMDSALSPLDITDKFFVTDFVGHPCPKYCNFPRPFDDRLPD